MRSQQERPYEPPHRRWPRRHARFRLRSVRRPWDSQSGFTLVELLLVIIIIGVLIGMGVPRLTGRSEQARLAAARADVDANLGVALDLYELDLGTYPSTEKGLDALARVPQDPGLADRWNGPYLKRGVPKDPWGRGYVYQYPGQHNRGGYDLYSAGKDGIEGNEDDVSNWDQDEAP